MPEVTEVLTAARTYLFVPGSRPDRFDRALQSGAECVIIDLEDAVGVEDKDEARAAVVQFLRASPPPAVPVLVRVNDPRTATGRADLEALSTARGRSLTGLLVPKADAESGWEELGALGLPLVALVESARGLRDVGYLARTPHVVRLALGQLDLCAELGLDAADYDVLSHARFQLVLASASAGLPAPVDGPCTSIREDDVVEGEARRAAAAGFTAKLCIHPDQLAAVVRGIGPSDEDVAWARRILDAVSGEGDLAEVDGKMVDRPVILRAQRILARRQPLD